MASPPRGEAPRDFERGAPLVNWGAAPYWQPEARTKPAHADVTLGTLAVTPIDPGPLPFVALSPCRIADTRGYGGFTGSHGPPAPYGGGSRSFGMVGQCGIPVSAQTVSLSFAVANTAGPGFLGAYPQGSDDPGVSTLNLDAGQTVANAAIVPLSAEGALAVVVGVPGFDLIIDVNGYYANPSTASSGAYDARHLAALRRYEAIVPHSSAVSIGSGDAFGMAFDGIYMWGTREGGDSPVFRIQVSDGLISEIPVAGISDAYGIAFDGSAIWAGAPSRLLKLNPSNGAVLATISHPYDNPKDVIFDGKYVWLAGKASPNTITRVRASDIADVVEFASGGLYPIGLAFDGANVWMTNSSSSGSVTKMRASDGVVPATLPVGGNPRGIVFDGVNVWVGSEATQAVHKIRAATAESRSAVRSRSLQVRRSSVSTVPLSGRAVHRVSRDSRFIGEL